MLDWIPSQCWSIKAHAVYDERLTPGLAFASTCSATHANRQLAAFRLVPQPASCLSRFLASFQLQVAKPDFSTLLDMARLHTLHKPGQRNML